MTNNFEVQNGVIVGLTHEAQSLVKCPSEQVEFVDKEITWDEAPYDNRLQTYDLSSYELTALEEEYLSFLHGL